MQLNDTPSQAAFRAQVRAWAGEHAASSPPRHRPPDVDEATYMDLRRRWQGVLADAGLAAVTWPEAFGGQDREPYEGVIVAQELAAAGAAGVADVIGVHMLGPTLMARGTREQQERHLGPLLRGEEMWCQLLSEPAAGSDLAAVQTRARRTEDGWRLTGQKVWTTNAQYASFGMALARTDPDVPKHRGLTVFVVPMDAPGVLVRPLRQISGEAEFNEVFLDDVAVGEEHVVGGVGDGWRTAMTILGFERMTLGLEADELGLSVERFAAALAPVAGTFADAGLLRAFGAVAAELLAVRYASRRALSGLARGRPPGPEAALTKITLTNASVAAADLVVDALGPEALAAGGDWASTVAFLPGLRSGGGTEEILRTTVGERLLGLPPEPRVDKDVPFSELRGGRRQETLS